MEVQFRLTFHAYRIIPCNNSNYRKAESRQVWRLLAVWRLQLIFPPQAHPAQRHGLDLRHCHAVLLLEDTYCLE